jgi:glycosyltransferase involved in cell wall biosynthesis
VIKVSVIVMTYNHADFIAQALDSALMQETAFPWEIIISEDCSSDGTREIVRAYRERFPKTVRLLLSEQNLASNRIVARAIEAARGEYIALLDGDDYWTSPHKLQRQADFLDAHPECAICFHNALVIDDDGAQPARLWTPENHPEITGLEDLWMGNYIATCSTMFRRGLFGALPQWYDAFFPITDWPLHILNAEHGRIGYLNTAMGVYRQHPGGCYSRLPQSAKLERTLDFYRRLNACLGFKYDAMVRSAVSKYFIEWAEQYLVCADIEAARRCFVRALAGRPVNPYISWRRFASLALRLYLPRAGVGAAARSRGDL